MKTKFAFLFCILFLHAGLSHSQKFTLGIENGINYSNIRKDFDHQRFPSISGAINGIFTKYELGNWFLIQSGIKHVSVNFIETQYHNYYPDYWMHATSSYSPIVSSSIYVPPSCSFSSTNQFNFLRIPILFKFRTPGKINLEIGGGYYYAFMINDEFRGKDKDRFDKEYREENFPDMTDWGWILASSVNYNINNKWSVFANGQVTYGKEKYFENVEGKLGSTELTLGIGYKPFAKQKQLNVSDSLGYRIQLIPHSGISITGIKSNKDNNMYKSLVGFSTGVSLKFAFAENTSLITGAWYDRKGYQLDYPGQYSAIYRPSENDMPPYNKSDVQLDYLTIPLLMELSFGKKFRSNIDFGAYYSLLQNAFTEGERVNSYQYGQGYRVNKEYFNESLDLWIKNYDIGFILGYRFEVPIFKWGNIFASVNQSFGLSNILEDNDDVLAAYPFIDDYSFKNRSTSILLGLTIPVNKK
uniref:outer membrane beta-barrel protein n=1 Tax=uncultured Draconibacterium sp. TaxID=1573823 RepID=UPI003216D9C9